MNCLLTSNGIRNKSIHGALVDLLGKPIAESNALFIPTAIYPFPGGAGMAWQAICGKQIILLESVGLEVPWFTGAHVAAQHRQKCLGAFGREHGRVAFWGGDPLYLSYWMRESGLTGLMPSLRREMVYVGVSAGSMVASSTFGETFRSPPNGSGNLITSEDIVFTTPGGEITRTFVTMQGAGLVDFALIPHLEHEDHADASLVNAEKWAARLPVPVYAIDDETAIKVTDGAVEVVSEGHWKLFTHSYRDNRSHILSPPNLWER